MANSQLAEGICPICGTPGIAGMSCTDPDCPGQIPTELGETKSKTTKIESDRYEDDDLLDDDDDPPVASTEALADDELEDDDDI